MKNSSIYSTPLCNMQLDINLQKKSNIDPPQQFCIYLSGASAVGKSFLVQLITEFMRRLLRYPD